MTQNQEKIYAKQEVEKATLDYFKGDKLATDVWIRKYCLKDENNYYELTPDDMHRRLAKELARIEAKYPNPLKEEQIYDTLKYFRRIVPQGSPMSGIGNDFQVVSLSNCFVIGNHGNSDSYGGIMKIDQEQVQLMKRRGGVGHDLSHIRPKGSPVKNSAISSTGIVPFMERYSNSTREVAQDGRRGALMLSISIKHPDSESFIDAKMEQGKVTGANVSIKLTDEFMNAALNNTNFLQQFPIDSNEPRFVKEVNAQKIWKKIIHNAWQSAEPGILFWDEVMSESIPDCYQDFGFKTISTNPCVSEDTLILTDLGYFKIGDLVNRKVNVWNGEEFSEVIPSITGYNQKMLKIAFSDGSELKCTPYHGFYTWEGYERDGKSIKKEAKDLVIGEKLEKYEFPTLFDHSVFHIDKTFYTLGFFAGDGFVKRDSTAHISLYGAKKNLLDKLDVIGNVYEDIENDKFTIRVDLPVDYFGIDLHELKKYVPKRHNNNLSAMISWLAGIIDSDGSRNSEEGSISISSIDKQFLMNIKLHLLNVMGVNGSVIDEKEGGLREIKGSEYDTNKSYRLIISAYNVKKLYDLGLRTYRVKIDDVNPNRDAGRFITVKSIEKIEDAEKVYCFTEQERGRGCFNGIVTANCGEIPLCPYDSCRLLAVNLFGYVINPFTKDARFDTELFKQDVIIAMRYMDDIIDLELEKIDAILAKIKSDPEDEFIKLYEIKLWENIKDMTLKGRRTGLGVTAEGDMLAALGLTYGTDEATDFSEKIHETLKLCAYESSMIMAMERGAFPIYDWKREENNPFIKRIKEANPSLYEAMKKHGRRNISLLTIAPTGTVSIMTQTTSGIEPVFLPVYMRRRKINPQEKDVRIDFVDDEGIAWMEYPVFHHNFELWLEINGYDIRVVKTMNKEQIDEIIKKSPYHKATSNDVDWVKKVEMQGRLQRHVDHSISVTVNLPETIDEETVAKVYETGWRTGCFPTGTSVYTENGIKDISKILIGDKVYGVDNKLHNVNKTFKLPKENRIIHHIKATGLEKISATSEHPFYVVELDNTENKKSWNDRKKIFKWKLAKDIKINDHLVVPKKLIYDFEIIETLSVADYIDIPIIQENDKLFLSRKLPWCDNKIVKSANSNPVPSIININDDFLKFIGWFIAKGHYNGKSEIRLTLNKEKEYDVLMELSNIVENIFGVETQIEETVDNAIRLKFHSRIISTFLENLVGKYSKNKHLPDFFTRIGIDRLNVLISSYYLGDGGVTISNRLARELFYSKILLNKKPYFKSNYGQGYYVNESTPNVQKTTAKELGEYYCYRVNKNIYEKFNDFVYNISVDDVDSYIVNGIITHNCKGITVYREGSRSGVLVSQPEKKSEFHENHASKRPKRLKGEIHRFQNNLEKWIAVVGIRDGRPYEIFTGKLENGLSNLPNNVKDCEVVKNIIEDENGVKKKRYDIEYVDSNGVKQVHTGLNHAFNPEYWNYAKLFSGVLRHGMPIVYVHQLIDSLNLNADHLNTWKNGVARVIKKYIKDGEKGKGVCPNCGSEHLEYKEGCLTCMSCGSSKCG